MASEAKKQAAKESYHWYLSHGICPKCKIENLQDGKSRCWRCRIKDNERMAARRAVETPEQKRERVNKQNQKSKALRDKRKAEGICMTCGKRKVEKGKTRCAYCREYHRKKAIEYYRRQGRVPQDMRGDGCCFLCLKPIESGRYCEEHLAWLKQHGHKIGLNPNGEQHPWQKYSASDVLRIEYRRTNGEDV